jgi:hypothetical protein
LALSRFIVSRLPVKTIVLPVHGVSGGRDEGAGPRQVQKLGQFLLIVRLMEEVDDRFGNNALTPSTDDSSKLHSRACDPFCSSMVPNVFIKSPAATAQCGGCRVRTGSGPTKPTVDRRSRLSTDFSPALAADQSPRCPQTEDVRRPSAIFDESRRCLPRPSMSIAPRDTKCRRRRCAAPGRSGHR